MSLDRATIEFRDILPESVVISELRVGTNRNVECLVEIDGLSYPFVWTQSFGRNVVNPSESQVRDYLSGILPEENKNSPNVLLMPLQANGRCGANCKGCVFARDIAGDALIDKSQNKRIATPTSPYVMTKLISVATLVAESLGVLRPDDQFRLNPLLSGDPAFSHYTQDLIKTIASNDRIAASRWSTIAIKTSTNPLEQFTKAAFDLMNSGSGHKARFQVSLHSSDEGKRAQHVSYHSNGQNPNLISAREIGEHFKTLKEITGFSSTLAFVVDKDTDISIESLSENFDPHSTWISLRPMISNSGYEVSPMAEKDFLRLYSDFRNNNWNVAIIPSTEGSMEQHNLNTDSS